MPDEKELEKLHKQAAAEMFTVLIASGRQMAEHEVAIAMGTARNDEGEGPDFGVQAAALKALRQQILGNPLQRIEQTSRATKITAHFELPADKIGAIETTALPPPSQLQLAPEDRKIPVMQAVKPSGRQILSSKYHETDKEWQQALDPSYTPPVYPDEDPTPMPKKP
jgi:hypothetical protein